MMQEPSHREISFRASSFGRFARQHGITSESQPVEPLGIIAPEYLKEAKIFIAALHMGERVFSFQIVFDDYRNSLPLVEDLLEYMANQAAVYEAVTDEKIPAFAKFIKRPVEVAREYVKDVRFQVPPFKGFLGPQIYSEFLKVTEARGPLPQ